jgi:hypothetical protein
MYRSGRLTLKRVYDMTREFDFLLASVRLFFRPGSPLPSKEGLDWGAVLELADQHAVGGFLRSACDPLESVSVSGLEPARSDLALSAELAKLADLFEKEMIEVVPLKGPVLGATLYQGKVLKASTDLDLLVRPSDALKAKALLESIGYRLLTVPHWPTGKAYLRNINNELAFRDPDSRLKLDLHWHLLPGYFPSPFDDAEVWASVRAVPWGNTRLQILSPEQQLMFLCAHGVKHLWSRLGWLCDLARLIQVEPGIDWSKVFDQTRRSHTTRVVLLSLLLVDNLLGVELPPPVAGLVAADPQVRVVAATVLERFRAARPESHAATALFCARALERNSHRSRLIFGMFFQPTEAEYSVVQLPPFLYWTYYLLRPLRLAAKHSRRPSGSRDRRVLRARKA